MARRKKGMKKGSKCKRYKYVTGRGGKRVKRCASFGGRRKRK